MSIDVEAFVRDGYVIVREAFPRRAALACRDAVLERASREPAAPVVHVKEAYGDGPFGEVFTDRWRDAVDALLGQGRWRWAGGRPQFGWWPVAYPGYDQPPWRPPAKGWHVDGIQFHHRLSSPEQALLTLALFSDVGSGDGGTAIAPGSHRRVAGILADAEPGGLDIRDLCARATAEIPEPVVEVCGRAGDVALCHPFMLHARSPNTGTRERVLCNPLVSWREPMAPDGESAVERAIGSALQAQVGDRE